MVAWLAAFAYLVFGHVFANGLCCADDSYISVGAKNLALGYGYGTSILRDSGEGLNSFDPGLSTGPTVVIPAAGLIRVFGITPWAPGLATALISLAALAGVFALLRRTHGALRGLAYIVVFVSLAYALTAGPGFVHWYAPLGEIPAALLCLLAAIVLSQSADRIRHLVVAGLLLGLAVNAKLLALFSVVPIGLWLLGRLAWGRGHRGNRAKGLAAFTLGLLAPSVLFDLWKLSVLGWDGYLANYRAFLAFSASAGVGEADRGSLAGLLEQVARSWQQLADGYSMGTLALALAAVVVVVLASAAPNPPAAARLPLLLLAQAAGQLSYFFLLSEGRGRYALVGLVLLAAAASCVVLIRIPIQEVVAVTVLAVIFFAGARSQLMTPIAFVAETRYQPVERLRNLQAAVEVLADRSAQRPFVGDWWATVADLEYALPTAGNFVGSQEAGRQESPGERLLARNTIWTGLLSSPEFEEWERQCGDVIFDEPPYLISRCPPGAAG
jgi:hypothetical protein